MTEPPKQDLPPGEEEEIGTGVDPLDPLKRDPEEDETMPGLDPVVILPPD